MKSKEGELTALTIPTSTWLDTLKASYEKDLKQQQIIQKWKLEKLDLENTRFWKDCFTIRKALC